MRSGAISSTQIPLPYVVGPALTGCVHIAADAIDIVAAVAHICRIVPHTVRRSIGLIPHHLPGELVDLPLRINPSKAGPIRIDFQLGGVFADIYRLQLNILLLEPDENNQLRLLRANDDHVSIVTTTEPAQPDALKAKRPISYSVVA